MGVVGSVPGGDLILSCCNCSSSLDNIATNSCHTSPQHRAPDSGRSSDPLFVRSHDWNYM